MKLFTAKCFEGAALRKLWRQTGNSSLLPAKSWPVFHVMRACSWRWLDLAWISARLSKLDFVFSIYQSRRFDPFILLYNFETKSRETLNFEGKIFHCVITTDTDNEINRSKRKTKALSRGWARKNGCEKVAIGLALTLIGWDGARRGI